VALWLQETAGLQVQGSQDAIKLRDASGQAVLTLRSAAGGQAVALMAHVASLPKEARLAAVLQMHLLRLCADPQDLHGMRVALTGDGQRVVLLDPVLQVQDGPALLARIELAMEMAQALGAEIDKLAREPSLLPVKGRDDPHAMWA
jgi:hypothetical protein